MRKLILSAVGVAALVSGSMAGAAAFLTNQVNLTTNSISQNASDITIAFTQNPLPTGSVGAPAAFNGGLDITNSASGLYSILIGTSTPGVTFTGGTLTNTATSAAINLVLGPTICCGANSSIGIAPTFFAPGTYRLAFNGLSTLATGTDAGTITISAAGVPEPATWAMMLVGFGGIGFAMRRRRQPALSQIA